MKKDYAFVMAVKRFGTLKKLAKEIGVEHTVLLYQRNHARSVDLRIALKIEIATDYEVRWYHLTEEKDKKIICRLEGNHPTADVALPSEKSFSERVFEAMSYEAELGNRRGKRTDLLLRENSHEVFGRTDKEVAKKFSIGSEWTYRLAKKVMQKGTFELIKAMDNGLSVSSAAVLAEEPHEQQRRILNLTKKEILTYARGREVLKKTIIQMT
jgi:DNA-binding transcriptional regulator YdaS (Cro superfamily)